MSNAIMYHFSTTKPDSLLQGPKLLFEDEVADFHPICNRAMKVSYETDFMESLVKMFQNAYGLEFIREPIKTKMKAYCINKDEFLAKLQSSFAERMKNAKNILDDINQKKLANNNGYLQGNTTYALGNITRLVEPDHLFFALDSELIDNENVMLEYLPNLNINKLWLLEAFRLKM